MRIPWAKALSDGQRLRRGAELHTAFSSRLLRPFLLAGIVALAVSAHVTAQVDVSAVHVLARTSPGSFAPRQHVVRTEVDLILVDVTVLDREGRTVSGLEPANFAVLDERDPQVIRHLSNVDEPMSLAVVLDTSASMASKVRESRDAVTELFNASNPQDDFSLIIVGDEPRVALHFDDSAIDIQRIVNALQPEGATALWDGMYLGIETLKNSRYQKKAMVVISDGGDNHSRYTESEVKSLLKEGSVAMYAIGTFDPYATRIEEKRGPLQLDEVTSVTGGRVLSAHSSADLSRAVTQISRELRNQYILGYYPSNRGRDGKWHKLKVQLAGSSSRRSFRLYAKKGYYAPAE
jgi:Ca-activated chloride channel family protein